MITSSELSAPPKPKASHSYSAKHTILKLHIRGMERHATEVFSGERAASRREIKCEMVKNHQPARLQLARDTWYSLSACRNTDGGGPSGANVHLPPPVELVSSGY